LFRTAGSGGAHERKHIGTGGGSIAWFDAAGILQVGPISAGGDPGPACYGRGGTEATVTDAKGLTGVINPNNFAVGQFRLDVDKAREAMAKVAERLGMTVEEAEVSIIRLVDASMINALKLVSIQRGHDPREFSLVVGGGGGAVHACQLARELGVKEVIVPLNRVNFGDGGIHDALVVDRAELLAGFQAESPLIVEEPTSTTMVLPGQTMRVDKYGFLRITENGDARERSD
jgi:N-methylhydantoinase A/oxoprolinase/acetone carboxylase beta subunit